MKKTVLVTGASGGIGGSCAREMARRGYTVYAHARREEETFLAFCETARTEGMDIHPCFADLTSSAEVREMCRQVLSVCHVLDGAVLAHGTSFTGLLCDMTDAQWHGILDANLSSVFYLCREITPSMVRRGSGSIVTMSSIWGLHGASCEAAYSAAKAGVIGLTQALSRELGPSGIRVNCVAPGVINTRMMAGYSQETREALAQEASLGRLGRPEEIAGICAFLLSEEAAFVTGQTLCADGGFL